MRDDAVDSLTMSLGDHLEDLRRRILLGLIGPVIGAIFMLFVGKQVLAILTQPVLYALASAGLEPTLYAPRVQAAFAVYIKVAIVGGLIIGIPWLLYHLWQFIAPGLYWRERRLVVYLIPFSTLLAAGGLLFMYYVMLPVTLWFLIQFTISLPSPSLQGSVVQQQVGGNETITVPEGHVDPPPIQLPMRLMDPIDPASGSAWINVAEGSLKWVVGDKVMAVTGAKQDNMTSPWFMLDDYVGFVLVLAAAFAITFQLPLVMLMLAWVGLVEYAFLKRVRAYAFLTCFVLAAVLTPPDVFSQILLGLPMYLLYEFGLVLMRIVERRRRETGAEAA
jgi:sec-independent protein translocase protein TatC